HIGRELREGARILGGHPALRIALGQVSLVLTVVFTVFALGPAYMPRLLGRPPTDPSLVLLPLTPGLVGSPLLLGRAAHRQPSRSRLAIWSTVSSGAALLGIG